MKHGIGYFFFLALLTLTASAQPGIVMSQSHNAGARVRTQTSVIGYRQGEELLLLELELIANRPTAVMMVIPFPSHPEVEPCELLSARMADLLQEKSMLQGDPTSITDRLRVVSAESPEYLSTFNLRTADLSRFEELSEYCLARPLAKKEREALERSLKNGNRDFIVQAFQVDSKAKLCQKFSFMSPGVYLPVLAQGPNDRLQVASLTEFDQFSRELREQLIRRLEKASNDSVALAEWSLLGEAELFGLDPELVKLFPRSALLGFVAADSVPLESPLVVPAIGEPGPFPFLGELNRSYFPLREKDRRTYRVTTGDRQFPLTQTLEVVDDQTDGSWLMKFVTVTPHYEYSNWKVLYEGGLTTGLIFGLDGQSYAVEPALPVYVASSFDYPEVGRMGSAVPGVSKSYQGKITSDGLAPVYYSETFKAVGFEEVEVPAGKFRALRTERHPQTPSSANKIRVEWYADGVGLIKVLEGTGPEQSIMELTDYLLRQ